MTDASAEHVPADPAMARVYLDQADRLLADGDQEGTSRDGKQILYYQACASAMEGVLLAGGRRVAGGDGAHVLRLSEASALLDFDEDLRERLDIQRETRHEVSYRAGVASDADVAMARKAATELLALARAFVERG